MTREERVATERRRQRALRVVSSMRDFADAMERIAKTLNTAAHNMRELAAEFATEDDETSA